MDALLIFALVVLGFGGVCSAIAMLWLYFSDKQSKADAAGEKAMEERLKTLPEEIERYYSSCDKWFESYKLSSELMNKMDLAGPPEANLLIIDGYLMYIPCDSKHFKMCIPVSECSEFSPATYKYEKYIGSRQVQTDNPKDKSVIGNAVVGGLIAGGAGAVVGAIAASDHNARNAATTPQTQLVMDYEKVDICAIRITYHGEKYLLPCDNFDTRYDYEREGYGDLTVSEFRSAIYRIRDKYPYNGR